MNYESDQQLQEIHDQMYRAEQERPKSEINNLSSQSKLFIGLFVGALIIFTFMKKIDIKEALMFALAGGIVIFFILQKGAERKELTWLECMMRLNDLLEFLQKHPIGQTPQIPKGKIHITPIGRKQWHEKSAFKRSFGVDIYDKELDITEHYFIEVDIFTGDVITFQHKPEGVTGAETKDIKMIPSFDTFMHRKQNEYLGKSSFRR